MQGRLDGRLAIVTGASQGIGAARLIRNSLFDNGFWFVQQTTNLRRSPQTEPVWPAPSVGVYLSNPPTRYERHATKTQVASFAVA